MQLATDIDHLINHILLKSENQHEFLIGSCESHLKLTNTQEHILMLLSKEQLTSSELAKRLVVSQAAVTKAVKSLVNQDLLTPVKDSNDARVTYFEVTETGQTIAQEHKGHHKKTLDCYQSILDQFSTEEQGVIDQFLKLLLEELEG